MKRHYQIRDTEGNVLEEGDKDITWERLRMMRDNALLESDWRFMSDQSPSDEWIAYRVMLRDLPQDNPGELANDACDAWEDYDKPEGA